MPLRHLFLGLLSMLAGLTACGPAAGPRPTVVLVLVDQLRKDAADRWMPETAALAARGVRFEQMRSCAPWTYPSVVSLLSGLWPQQHGADANQRGDVLSVFSTSVPLLPRELQAAGYYTAGFVANPFLHEWNPVHEAFDHYDASFIGNQGAHRGRGELVWTERMYADTLTPAVLEHFRSRPQAGPEFVYVHFIDVHGRRADENRWAQAPFEPSYEAATRYVDARIRELYDFFQARSAGDLLFVVTSDHGQDAGDDLEIGERRPWRERKASLHDFNLRIPCWILPGQRVPAGRTIAEPCSNVDLAPTLRDWLGLEPPAVQAGISLLPALEGRPYDGRARTLYAKNSSRGRVEDCTLHEGQKYLRTQLVQHQAVDVRRRFDLATDPREQHPLPGSSEAEERLLEAAGPHAGAFAPRWEEPEDDMRDQLQALGYGDRGEAPGNDE